MLYAKKSNRVHPIQDFEAQYYVNQGYNIIDRKGNIVIESMPDDVIGLKTAFRKHVEDIAKLKETINRLSAENDELKIALEQTDKARATKTTKAKKAKDAEVVAETADEASDE